MRGVLLSLICAAGLLVAVPAKSAGSFAPVHATISSAPAPMLALQQPGKTVDINITTNNSGGGRWYRSPIWIAVMAIGGVVLLMLLVMAARGGSSSGSGGGTTIVK